MADGEDTTGLFNLPKFPTAYTPEDVQRLQQLEEQRKAMALAYGSKFSKEAWAKVPGWEKFARAAIPTWTIPAIKALPGTIETWEFGFTPEQFEGTMEDVEKEYQEIARRKKVTSLLPNIQASIMLTALKGEPILDTSELLSTFPELRQDFTDEEISYLARLSQILARATPEEILSGSIFGYGTQLPISQEDVEALFPEERKDPRFLLSTVAFSKDLEEISSALQEAYPPEAAKEELSDKTLAEWEDWIRKYYIEQGIIPPEVLDKEAIQKANEEIAAREGGLITWTDETGKLSSGMVKEDGSVWERSANPPFFRERLVGYYNEGSGEIVPFGLDGEPMFSEEEQESKFKDILDAFYLGLAQFWSGSIRAITTELPLYFLPLLEMPVSKEEPAPGESSLDLLRKHPVSIPWELAKRYPVTGSFFLMLPREVRVAINEQNKIFRDDLLQGYAIRTEEYNLWVEEHPELKPRKEWEGGTLEKIKEDPKILLDPAYIAFVAAESAAFMGAFWGATAAVGYATKNPMLGMAAGVAMTTPFEIDQLQSDLISVGVDPEQAIQWAVPVGGAIASVEMLGGYVVLRAIGATPGGHIFYRALKTNLNKEIGRAIVRQMAVRGLVVLTEVELGEILEEVIQGAMHNALVYTFDSTREVFSNVPETIVRTAIATLPMGLGASVTNVYQEVKKKLPSEVRKDIEDRAEELKDKGLTPEQAETEAYLEAVETETGQEQVREAAEKANIHIYAEEVPEPEKEHGGEPKEPLTPTSTSKEITNIERRIEGYAEQIQTLETSLEAQRDRLQKMVAGKEAPGSRLEQHGLVEKLENDLADMQKTKALAQKKLEKAQKEAAETAPPVAEEVTRENTREMPASWVELNNLLAKKPRAFDFHRFMELYSQLAIEQKAFPDELVDELYDIISKHKPPVQYDSFDMAFRDAEATGARMERAVAIDVYAQLMHPDVAAFFSAYGMEGLSEAVKAQIAEATNKVLDDLHADTPRLKRVSYTTKTVKRFVTKAEAVETPQEEAVDSTTANEAHTQASPWVQADPLLPTRRPRTQDWDDEQAGVDEALKDPKIAKAVKLPPVIAETRKLITNTINRLQDEYEAAKKVKDKEAIQEIEKTLKNMAKVIDLPSKALLGKRWDDLPPETRLKLTASMLPDKTLKFSGLKEALDMEYFMQFLEEMTGAPWYSMLVRVEKATSAAETAKELILQRISTDPHFKAARTDKKALERIAQEINARNELQNVEHPTDISDEELMLADAIEDIYSYYKPIVRYLRVMRTQPDIENFKKEFPDAVEEGKEAELEMTIKLIEEGTLDDLWNYLYTKTWGVIEHGFDPRLIASPGLRVGRRGGLKVTRGKGRLIRRESIEYPAGKMHQDVLARLASYVEQMEIQWRVEPEIDKVAEWWDLIGDKFENWGQIEQGLETWLERVQNIGLGYNFYDRMVRRLWRQAMVAVFLEPYMAFRNSFQALVFHPDRMELPRYLLEKGKLPADLKEQFKIFFDTNISQLGGLRRDWLHVGEKGFLVPDFANRLADSICLYGKSDYYPRRWSALAALNKAYRATEQYLKDGDIDKWIKNSGAIHLRQTERNYVISHYLGQIDKKFDEGIAGLRGISGARMAEFYIARRIADITHFKYRRSTRGLMEMGKTGSTLWNLVVFPRGYATRLYFQAEKIKRLFSGEATWAEARTGFTDIMKLLMVSMLFGQLFTLMTGRRRNPYDPLNIIFGWQFGGLFIGIAQDVFKLGSSLFTVINPNAAEEDKAFAVSDLVNLTPRVSETLIPFLRRGIDIAETVLDKKNILKYGVRQIRAKLDEDYTPEELEDMDRALWEQIRKAVLGGEILDPTKLDNALVKMEDAQTKLGTMSITGRYYTLGDFGSEISSATKDIPTVFLTEQEGLTPLALFYLECDTQYSELFTLPSSERDDWREEHITEEAMLLFWERYKRPVFDAGTPEAKEVTDLLLLWFDQYDIDKSMHQWWTTWELPVEIPTEE